MKNILLLDTGKEWGGGTNSLFELLKRINRDKYRFTALFYNNYRRGSGTDVKSEMEKLGITFLLLAQKKQTLLAKMLKEVIRLVFFFSGKAKRHLVFLIDYQFKIKRNAKTIADILIDSKVDLLYMNNQPSSNLEGILASRETGIPTLQHSRIEARINSFEAKVANDVLKKMICVSHGVKNSFVRQGIDAARCVVVHNGIDSGTKPFIPPQDIRRKWGISDNDILIGTVGSLIKRKRVKDLLEALSIIAGKTEHTIKCMIVGEGPERDGLLSEVERLRLKSVVFTGFQPDAISYISAMDIFVLPSEKEGLPRVILEAMLMGKPVVASQVTGPSELVVNKETGLLVPVNNPAMLACAISTLIEQPALRVEMGNRGRRRVVDNFSIEQYVSGVEKVFSEVLEF